MSTRHQWTETDDERLLVVVDETAPLFDLYTAGSQNRRYASGNAWDAVAGRMLPEVRVTGEACRHRWHGLREAQAAAAERAARTHSEPEALDAWARVSALVDEYETSALEALERVEGATERMEQRLIVIEGLLVQLARVWEVTP
jgi:hypothetical protein